MEPVHDRFPADYAAVVAGGSIHAGHHRRELLPAAAPVS